MTESEVDAKIATCAFAIASGDLQVKAVQLQGAYACRADGRSGSVSRGSPILHADLLCVYTVPPRPERTRAPQHLKLEHTFLTGLSARQCRHCGFDYLEREPIRRFRSRHLAAATASSVGPGEWPDTIVEPARRPGAVRDRRPRLLAPPGTPGAVAHTNGSEYFVLPVIQISRIVGPAALTDLAPEWGNWVRSLIADWERETREDDFGEPFVRLLPQGFKTVLNHSVSARAALPRRVRSNDRQTCPRCRQGPLQR